MGSYQITRLEETDGVITKVGSTNWVAPVEDVIKWMETGQHTFYAIINIHRVSIHVGKSNDGTKYLTTSQDGNLPNSIEELIVN